MFKRSASKLYNWVALMIVLGAVVGHFWPAPAWRCSRWRKVSSI